jgi:hypothetical protein
MIYPPLSDDARRLLRNPATPPYVVADALEECGWGETETSRAMLDGLRDPVRGPFNLDALVFMLLLKLGKKNLAE